MSNENVKPDAAAAPAAFTLTHDLVKSWSPCTDGYRWFLGKFPQGGAYTAVHAALRQDNRFDDAGWLFRAALSHALSTTPAVTVDLVAAQDDDATKLIEATSPTKIKAPAADDVKVVVENDNGDDSAQIGSSGNGARINTTGERATIACAGLRARAKAGKDGAIALAYWDERSERTRFAVGYVGESIEADKWYSVTEEGEFVEAAHE